MDPEIKAAAAATRPESSLRSKEIEALGKAMPLDGPEFSKLHVFNVWGEQSVGKTAFLTELRESEFMAGKRTLWIHPTDARSIDNIEEFIAAASKGVRYPSHPEKEKAIAEAIDSVQRGKINPMVSDDSILISRSKLASNKKPYINQAASASVGRTPFEREEMEVSVGLGENKADNQAEGFLEALPLQSLGTDSVILHLGRLNQFAGTVIDWIKGYLIPAAAKGPYRRHLLVLLESDDPIHRSDHEAAWGEWADATYNYRLLPANDEAAFALAAKNGLTQDAAQFAFLQSLGYPASLADEIAKAKQSSPREIGPAFASLLPEDQIRLAALCLPRKLYPDELDALLGNHRGAEALDWLRTVPLEQPAEADGGKAFTLSVPFRQAVIAAAQGLPGFPTLKSHWLSYGRLVRNVPAKPSRLKLLMLSRLNWIDHECCASLFENQTAKVEEFFEKEPKFFIRRDSRYRISERIRGDLAAVAENMGNLGAAAIHEKAVELWNARRQSLEAEIHDIEEAVKALGDDIYKLSRKQSETEAYLRVMEKKAKAERSTTKMDGEKPYAVYITFLFIAAVALFAIGQTYEYPANLAFLVGALASLCVGLAIFPSWSSQRKARLGHGEAGATSVRRENADLSRQHQSMEGEIADLQRSLNAKKRLLEFSYV